jgi:hypothetical protein
MEMKKTTKVAYVGDSGISATYDPEIGVDVDVSLYSPRESKAWLAFTDLSELTDFIRDLQEIRNDIERQEAK